MGNTVPLVLGAQGEMESLAARDGTVHQDQAIRGKEGHHRGAVMPQLPAS